MDLSSNGLAHIARCETLKLTAYRDGAGKWAIGYGHTTAEVTEGMTCTEAEALAWLTENSRAAAEAVNRLCPVAEQGQFDAMTSLVYRVGVRLFVTSHVRSYHMGLQPAAAADAFLMWDKQHSAETGQVEYCRGQHKRCVMDRAIYLGATADDAAAIGERWLAEQSEAHAAPAAVEAFSAADAPEHEFS